MFFKKPQAIIFLLLLLSCHNTFGQREKIDSLKKVLKSLNGNSKVDCLNELSDAYTFLRNDTAYFYAEEALVSATKINYTQGIGKALYNRGVNEFSLSRLSVAEHDLHKAISFFEKTYDYKGLGWAYFYLGVVLENQSIFYEAVTTYKKAILFFQKVSDKDGEGRALGMTGVVYKKLGDYQKGFEFIQKSLALRKNNRDSLGIAFALADIGNFFQATEDYENALQFYKQSADVFIKIHKVQICDYPYREMGTIYGIREIYDSSQYFFQQALNISPNDNRIKVGIAENYLRQKKYEMALNDLLKALEHFRKSNDRNYSMRALLDIGKAYVEKKDYETARRYAKEGLVLAGETKARPFLRDACQLLSVVYDHLGKVDSAYSYLKKYTVIKDSIVNDQIKGKLFAFKKSIEDEQKQAHIDLLNKENELKDIRLNQERNRRYILIATLIIGLLVAGFLIGSIQLKRRKDILQHLMDDANAQLESRRKEQQLAELEQQKTELELKVLRSQINEMQKLQQMRTLIASDLHDEIGSTLTSISYYSEMVKMQLKGEYTLLKPVLDKIGGSARNTVRAMSDIVWIINPKNDTTENLVNRMKHCAAEMLGDRNIQYTFNTNEVIESAELNMQQRKNVYLIFREAIHNAVKYAHCNNVEINFIGKNHEISLNVYDNGNGFDMQHANDGNGLANMKRRAEEIDAHFAICSGQNKGTQIKLTCKIT